MSGYLDNFGQSDAQRERKFKRVAGGLILAVVVCLAGWLFSRDFFEKRQVSNFFDLVKSGKYNDAYHLWGCDSAKPCKDYNWERFLEDWGPKSQNAAQIASTMRVRRTRSCEMGIISVVEFKPGDEVFLFVDRSTRQISFSPWGYCVDSRGRNVNFWDRFFP
jgi:hypothetical protein